MTLLLPVERENDSHPIPQEIRTFDRVGASDQKQVQAPGHCAFCGEALPKARPTGRPRRFCSDTCRLAAWKRRSAPASYKHNYPEVIRSEVSASHCSDIGTKLRRRRRSSSKLPPKFYLGEPLPLASPDVLARVSRMLAYRGGAPASSPPRPTRQLTRAEWEEMRLRTWGGLRCIQADPILFERALLALGISSLKEAIKGCKIRLGGVLEVGEKSYAIRRRNYSVRVFLEKERQTHRGTERLLRPVPVYLFCIPSLTPKPIFTAAELFCLLTTGRIRVGAKKRRIANGASLTWWLLLLWKAGLLEGADQATSPHSGLRLLKAGVRASCEEELVTSNFAEIVEIVERTWRLLWHLRNIVRPGEPVKFSLRFAQSLCGGSVIENRVAIHHLRIEGVMHAKDVTSDKHVGFAYVMGDGKGDPSFRDLPSGHAANIAIHRVMGWIKWMDRHGHIGDLSDRQSGKFEDALDEVWREIENRPLEMAGWDDVILSELRDAYHEARIETANEAMAEVLRMNAGGKARV